MGLGRDQSRRKEAKDYLQLTQIYSEDKVDMGGYGWMGDGWMDTDGWMMDIDRYGWMWMDMDGCGWMDDGVGWVEERNEG